MILLVVSILAGGAGWGMLKRLRWARILGAFLSILLAVYCLAYLIFASGKFQGQGFLFVTLLLVFCLYSLWATMHGKERTAIIGDGPDDTDND